MTTNYVQARDEMFSLFADKWNAESAAIAGYIPELLFEGTEKAGKPSNAKYWARLSMQSVLAEQSTLSTCEGAAGQKMYTDNGLIFIQLFAPKSEPAGYVTLANLAMLARNVFRNVSTPGKVWFRNARINPLSPEEVFYRFNVVAEFEYDEIF